MTTVDLSPWSPGDIPADVPPLPDALDVPYVLDTLPDGTETLVLDLPVPTDHVHEQGDNDLGFQGTCGLCACQDVLNQFGVRVTENDVVHHARDNNLCTVSDDPLQAGGVKPWEAVELLSDYGIPSHVDHAGSLEDLAAEVEQRRGVIIGVNSGVLAGDGDAVISGFRDHAVTVINVARSPITHEVQGFYINDSAPGHAREFVDARTMTLAWLIAGGELISTDITRADAPVLAGGNV